MSWRKNFAALDSLTLTEIEAMFGQGVKTPASATLSSLQAATSEGRLYEQVPGAIFYELEDLGVTPRVVKHKGVLELHEYQPEEILPVVHPDFVSSVYDSLAAV